jgi:hypothetical protein
MAEGAFKPPRWFARQGEDGDAYAHSPVVSRCMLVAQTGAELPYGARTA